MSSSTATRLTIPKLKVLVVDDNEIHCYAMQKILVSADFEVAGAHTGGEALKAVNEVHPDAVLLDIGLGKDNGFDVCNMIRENSQNDHVAIVFHSATGHADISPRARRDGGDAFLTYPVDSEHLASVIRGCVQRRRDTNPSSRQAKSAS